MTRAGKHAAIIAVGAIGAGAAPVDAIDGALASLDKGGLFIVSLNDHTLQDPAFERRLTHAAQRGAIEILEADHGPHLPAIGLGAKVYVARKL